MVRKRLPQDLEKCAAMFLQTTAYDPQELLRKLIRVGTGLMSVAAGENQVQKVCLFDGGNRVISKKHR